MTMTDETPRDEGITIDTPGGIQTFMWLRYMHMIAVELNTTMTHSGGPILRQLYRAGLIDAELKSTKANKRMVLAAMIETMQEIRPDYVPSDSIKRALES